MEVSNIKITLKMKLSLTIILVVLITVGLIGIIANFYIKDEFKNYILRNQEKTMYGIVDQVSKEYNKEEKNFDLDTVLSIGMDALYDGYIISLYDSDNKAIWDAESCDENLCSDVMKDITTKMKENYPKIDGEFITKVIDVNIDGKIVGSVEINYYGPFFLTDDDFNYLSNLNEILIVVGIVAFIVSIIIGVVIAKKISEPIRKTVEAAREISSGDYAVRIKEKTDTKEMDDLVVSINNLADSLQKQENIRKQLTADIAHEFRTPLTTLQTHLEAMIEGIWEADVNRLQSCHDEIIRISNMVKDLESLARVEGANLKLNKSEISLLEIASKVVNNQEKDIKNKNLLVEVKGKNTKLLADRDRITQVVINLLSNAIKYTNDGGIIKVEIFEMEDYLVLTVQDNGIGIGRDDLPFIFERFYRTDKSRNHTTGGSGIGLAIVKSIVIAHGGKVNVDSEIDKGSRFTIKIPKV